MDGGYYQEKHVSNGEHNDYMVVVSVPKLRFSVLSTVGRQLIVAIEENN